MKSKNLEIERFLHFKAEIRKFKFLSPQITKFKLSDFGFKMQESFDFKMLCPSLERVVCLPHLDRDPFHFRQFLH